MNMKNQVVKVTKEINTPKSTLVLCLDLWLIKGLPVDSYLNLNGGRIYIYEPDLKLIVPKENSLILNQSKLDNIFIPHDKEEKVLQNPKDSNQLVLNRNLIKYLDLEKLFGLNKDLRNPLLDNMILGITF